VLSLLLVLGTSSIGKHLGTLSDNELNVTSIAQLWFVGWILEAKVIRRFKKALPVSMLLLLLLLLMLMQ